MFLLTGLAVLAGCGGADKAPAGAAPEDAAMIEALAAPIMTDADLSALNDGHSAIMVSGPANSSLPPIDSRPEAIDAAREAAARVIGGRFPALSAATSEDLGALRKAVTAAQMAIATGIATPACAATARYTARWAVELPSTLQVYPRGAVEEAAGSDASGCAWRVVHFRTPVPVEEVVAFYRARMQGARWPAKHGIDGEEHLLSGRKGGASYRVYVRKSPDGLTATDIAVSGRP